MGKLLRETSLNIALVGMDPATGSRFASRLVTMKSGEDLGNFQVRHFDDIVSCAAATNVFKANGICLQLSKFSPRESVQFIAHIRAEHPHVAFCLVGTQAYLKELKGFETLKVSPAADAMSWKERFEHYFKLHTDLLDTDFEIEAGSLRDLFVADSIKSRALGLYQTTPGAVVKWREGAPKGSGLAVFAGLAGALIGAVVSPLVTYMLPEKGAAIAAATRPAISPSPSPPGRDEPHPPGAASGARP